MVTTSILACEWYWTDTCVLVLVICPSRTQSTRTWIFSLISGTIINFLALNQVVTVIHILMNLTLIHRETSVIVSVRCSSWQYAMINMTVILMVIIWSIIMIGRYLVLWCYSACRLTPPGLRHILLRKLCESMRRCLRCIFICFMLLRTDPLIRRLLL